MSDNARGSSPQAAAGVSLVTVIIALIFLFVWPGPLRYEYRDYDFKVPGEAPTLLKIDRISHDFWIYNGEKWQKQ